MPSNVIPLAHTLIIVERKLTAPRTDDTPARCNEKIAKSTDGSLWDIFICSGGYTAHPVPSAFLQKPIQLIRRLTRITFTPLTYLVVEMLYLVCLQ